MFGGIEIEIQIEIGFSCIPFSDPDPDFDFDFDLDLLSQHAVLLGAYEKSPRLLMLPSSFPLPGSSFHPSSNLSMPASWMQMVTSSMAVASSSTEG